MVLEKLTAKQKELKQSDIQFAKTLGIPRVTWQHTRTGRRALGTRVAKAAMRAFPDLTPDIVVFLLSDATSEAELTTHVA